MNIWDRLPLIRDIRKWKSELEQCQSDLLEYESRNKLFSEEAKSKIEALHNAQIQIERTAQIMEEAQKKLEAENQKLRMTLELYSESAKQQHENFHEAMERFEELSGQEAREKLEEVSRELRKTFEESIKNTEGKIENLSARLTESVNFLESDAYFDHCNLRSTVRPVVWGDSKRLHISPKAAVLTCFFNVNSGEITVGDFSFAGSGVSILAGSHDMCLPGFVRRDAEFTEGCDIVIGNGVWLGSNSTILGPAKIGNHAVIAAGSVVTPGTEIEENSVYGGIPAKKIKSIEPIDPYAEPYDTHIQNALHRNKELLCVQGWHEKEPMLIDGERYVVHKMNEEEASILTTRDKVRIRADNRMTVDETIVVDVLESMVSGKTLQSSKFILKPGINYIEIQVGEGTFPARWVSVKKNENVEIAV